MFPSARTRFLGAALAVAAPTLALTVATPSEAGTVAGTPPTERPSTAARAYPPDTSTRKIPSSASTRVRQLYGGTARMVSDCYKPEISTGFHWRVRQSNANGVVVHKLVVAIYAKRGATLHAVQIYGDDERGSATKTFFFKKKEVIPAGRAVTRNFVVDKYFAYEKASPRRIEARVAMTPNGVPDHCSDRGQTWSWMLRA